MLAIDWSFAPSVISEKRRSRRFHFAYSEEGKGFRSALGVNLGRKTLRTLSIVSLPKRAKAYIKLLHRMRIYEFLCEVATISEKTVHHAGRTWVQTELKFISFGGMRDLIDAYVSDAPYKPRSSVAQVASAIKVMQRDPKAAVEALPEKVTTRIRSILSTTQLTPLDQRARAVLSLVSVHYEGPCAVRDRAGHAVRVRSRVEGPTRREYLSRFSFDQVGERVERLADPLAELQARGWTTSARHTFSRGEDWLWL